MQTLTAPTQFSRVLSMMGNVVLARFAKPSRSELHQKLIAIRPHLAKAAQEEYDQWDASDPEFGDAVNGFGGICHDIADRIGDVLSEHGIDSHTVDSGGMGEQHVWQIAHNGKEAFHVDISPHHYETGGGYNWQKIPGVKFGPDHIDISPANIEDIEDLERFGKDTDAAPVRLKDDDEPLPGMPVADSEKKKPRPKRASELNLPVPAGVKLPPGSTMTARQLVQHLSGMADPDTPIDFVAHTDARARKTGNPHHPISKLAHVSGTLNSNYGDAMRQIDPNYVPKEVWHDPDVDIHGNLLPFAVHGDGTLYLRLMNYKNPHPPKYFNGNGEEISTDDAKAHLPEKGDRKIAFNVFSLPSIKHVKIGDKSYVIDHSTPITPEEAKTAVDRIREKRKGSAPTDQASIPQTSVAPVKKPEGERIPVQPTRMPIPTPPKPPANPEQNPNANPDKKPEGVKTHEFIANTRLAHHLEMIGNEHPELKELTDLALQGKTRNGEDVFQKIGEGVKGTRFEHAYRWDKVTKGLTLDKKIRDFVESKKGELPGISFKSVATAFKRYADAAKNGTPLKFKDEKSQKFWNDIHDLARETIGGNPNLKQDIVGMVHRSLLRNQFREEDREERGSGSAPESFGWLPHFYGGESTPEARSNAAKKATHNAERFRRGLPMRFANGPDLFDEDMRKFNEQNFPAGTNRASKPGKSKPESSSGPSPELRHNPDLDAVLGEPTTTKNQQDTYDLQPLPGESKPSPKQPLPGMQPPPDAKTTTYQPPTPEDNLTKYNIGRSKRGLQPQTELPPPPPLHPSYNYGNAKKHIPFMRKLNDAINKMPGGLGADGHSSRERTSGIYNGINNYLGNLTEEEHKHPMIQDLVRHRDILGSLLNGDHPTEGAVQNLKDDMRKHWVATNKPQNIPLSSLIPKNELIPQNNSLKPVYHSYSASFYDLVHPSGQGGKEIGKLLENKRNGSARDVHVQYVIDKKTGKPVAAFTARDADPVKGKARAMELANHYITLQKSWKAAKANAAGETDRQKIWLHPANREHYKAAVDAQMALREGMGGYEKTPLGVKAHGSGLVLNRNGQPERFTMPHPIFSDSGTPGKLWGGLARQRGINPVHIHALAKQYHEQSGMQPHEAYREAASDLEPETTTGLTRKKQDPKDPPINWTVLEKQLEEMKTRPQRNSSPNPEMLNRGNPVRLEGLYETSVIFNQWQALEKEIAELKQRGIEPPLYLIERAKELRLLVAPMIGNQPVRFANEHFNAEEPEKEPELGSFIASKFKDKYGESSPDDEITGETGFLLHDGTPVKIGSNGGRDVEHGLANPSVDAMKRWGWPKDITDFERKAPSTRIALHELLKRAKAARIAIVNGFLLVHHLTPLTKEQKEKIVLYSIKNKPPLVQIYRGRDFVSEDIDSYDPRKLEKALSKPFKPVDDEHKGSPLRFARVPDAEVHPDYQPTGIAPRVGHMLQKLAEGGDERDTSTIREVAATALRTGNHRVLPILADALDDNAHSAAEWINWRHAPRGIAIDKVLADEIAKHQHRGYGPNGSRRGGTVQPLSAGWILADWRQGARSRLGRRKALAFVRQSVPDATTHDLHHSILRLYDNDETKREHQWMNTPTDTLRDRLLDNGYDPEHPDFGLQQILAGNHGRLPNWMNENDVRALEEGEIHPGPRGERMQSRGPRWKSPVSQDYHENDLHILKQLGTPLESPHTYPDTRPPKSRTMFGKDDGPIRFADSQREQRMRSDLASASQRMRTANHETNVKVLQTILDSLGMRPHTVKTVIHDTPEGSRPAVAAAVGQAVDDIKAFYGAAWSGLLNRQPGMLVFQSHDDGPDSLYRIGAKGNGDALRQLLDAAGIAQRVIVPQENGSYHVLIHDAGRKLRKNVAAVARQLSTNVGESKGTGSEIGGGDGAETRSAYRNVTRKVEDGDPNTNPKVKSNADVI